jgi:hypothetical protein
VVFLASSLVRVEFMDDTSRSIIRNVKGPGMRYDFFESGVFGDQEYMLAMWFGQSFRLLGRSSKFIFPTWALFSFHNTLPEPHR